MVFILKRMLLSVMLVVALGLVAFPTNKAHASFQLGSTGSDVVAIQNALIEGGYYNGLANGVFDADTAAAVRKYQASAGLSADGVVGNYTYSKLLGSSLPVSRGGYSVSRGGTSALARNIINIAYQYLGVPYVFGGTSPWGFDCSGFTQYVYRKAGINLPRTADVQYYSYPKVSSSNLKPGDLVFFETYEPGPSHCGIYIGGGQMIQAGSSTGITVSNVFTGYWGSRYIGAARIF